MKVMKSRSVLIFILFIFLFSGMRLARAQQSIQCLAVITEINGEALLKKVNRKEFSKTCWGTQLYRGDEIRTADKSEVKLLFSNSSLISLGPNSTLKISGSDSSSTESKGNVRNLSSASMINLTDMIPKREEINDIGALAGLRSATVGQEIELTTPENTLIKTNRPSFSWIPKKSYDNFTVNLYSSKGKVWSKTVTKNSMNYPESEKALDFGESYFWNVEGEYLINTDKSLNHKFTVLSLEKSKEVEENEGTIRNMFLNNPESSSLHSVLGAYYINKGLLGDAINEFQDIARLNIDSSLPHELLGSLYSETGDKDKAIDELQKALILTKEKEK
jgi:tetratricopeptide (TPR) repeat protein